MARQGSRWGTRSTPLRVDRWGAAMPGLAVNEDRGPPYANSTAVGTIGTVAPPAHHRGDRRAPADQPVDSGAMLVSAPAIVQRWGQNASTVSRRPGRSHIRWHQPGWQWAHKLPRHRQPSWARVPTTVRGGGHSARGGRLIMWCSSSGGPARRGLCPRVPGRGRTGPRAGPAARYALIRGARAAQRASGQVASPADSCSQQ